MKGTIPKIFKKKKIICGKIKLTFLMNLNMDENDLLKEDLINVLLNKDLLGGEEFNKKLIYFGDFFFSNSLGYCPMNKKKSQRFQEYLSIFQKMIFHAHFHQIHK
jgi:hypothetical protein